MDKIVVKQIIFSIFKVFENLSTPMNLSHKQVLKHALRLNEAKSGKKWMKGF